MAFTHVRQNITLQQFIETDHFQYNRPFTARGDAMVGQTWNPVGEGNIFLVTYEGRTEVLSGNARKHCLEQGGFTNPPVTLSVIHFTCDSFGDAIELYHLTVVKGQAASNPDIQHTAAASADLVFANELMKSRWKSPLSSVGARTEAEIEAFYRAHRNYLQLIDATPITRTLANRLGTGGVKAAIAKILNTSEHEDKLKLAQFCGLFFSLNRRNLQVIEWCEWEDLGFPGFVEGHPGNTGNDKTINQKEKFTQLFNTYKNTTR